MPRTLSLRDLTTDERAALERLAHSRTSPARLVERARIVLAWCWPGASGPGRGARRRTCPALGVHRGDGVFVAAPLQ